MMTPHVLDHVENDDGENVPGTTFKPNAYQTSMQPQTAATVRDLMIDVVNNGTGTAAQIPGIQVAGKTGTAEVQGEQPHAWFIAFAPADRAAVRDRGARRARREQQRRRQRHRWSRRRADRGAGARRIVRASNSMTTLWSRTATRGSLGAKDRVAPMSLVGRVFSNRYEIQREIAQGGMAEVYLAHDRLLDRPVALKALFPEYAREPSFVERFRREAQAAANLNHPTSSPSTTGARKPARTSS